MPPFKRRSTGRRKMARTISFGGAVAPVMPSMACASAESVIDFAARDAAALVIVPTRARQQEKTLPLVEARRRIGGWIEKDVLVVKSGFELCMARHQHRVAEDIARHIADANGGERLGLNIDSELAKMPLYALPRAARGDP